MICKLCADAADGNELRLPACPVCLRTPMAVYNDAVPVAEQRVYRHGMCPGSFKPPAFPTGHDYCKGCDCQHGGRGQAHVPGV